MHPGTQWHFLLVPTSPGGDCKGVGRWRRPHQEAPYSLGPAALPIPFPWEPRGRSGVPDSRPSDVGSEPGSKREAQWGKPPKEGASPSPLGCGPQPSSPTDLLTQLRGDPGSVPHRVEEFHLQLEELLIEVWPVLPAQQELEDAPLGRGVVFFHVGGDVAATRKEGRLDSAFEDSQPQGKGGQWRGCRGPLEEPASGTEYPGLGSRGAPLAGAPGSRQQDGTQHRACPAQGKVLAAVIPLGVSTLGHCLRAVCGVSWLHSSPQDLTGCLPLL